MKRKASTSANKNKSAKKQKIGVAKVIEKNDTNFEEDFDSDLSRSEDAEANYEIKELLMPQERQYLQEDPWGTNILVDSWSNDLTLVLDPTRKTNRRWTDDQNASNLIPDDIFWHILVHSDVVLLCKWRRVSKYFDNLIGSSSAVWKHAFYQRRWRLPHEILNFNRRYEPNGSETIIDDKKVDWFNESKRNYLNATRIRDLIKEISNKLQNIVYEYGYCIGKTRSKTNSDLRKFFNDGLTDADLDDWETINEFKLTNDFRELYKCMNGALFKFKTKEVLSEEICWDYCCSRPTPICFPKLEKITVKEINTLEHDGAEEAVNCVEKTERMIGSPINRTPLAFSEVDLQSDESSYEISNQSDSISDIDEYLAKNDTTKVLFLGNFSIEGDNTREMAYEPIMGGIITLDESSNKAPETLSIVEYLQHIRDLMDDCRAPLFFEFENHDIQILPRCLKELRQKYEEESCYLYEEQSDTKGLAAWIPLIAHISDDFGCEGMITPRSVKMIIAAAQELLVNVFSKAQAMETSDVLQVDTFINAANSVCPQIDQKFISVTDPKSHYHFILKNITISDKIVDL